MLQIERQMIFLWKRIRPPYVYLHNFQWVSCERRPWRHLLIFPIRNDINIFCHKLIMLLEPWLWMEPENLSDNSINFVTSKNIWVFDPWFSPSFTTEKNQVEWHTPGIPALRRTRSSASSLATYLVLGQPGLHETLCQKVEKFGLLFLVIFQVLLLHVASILKEHDFQKSVSVYLDRTQKESSLFKMYSRKACCLKG